VLHVGVASVEFLVLNRCLLSHRLITPLPILLLFHTALSTLVQPVANLVPLSRHVHLHTVRSSVWGFRLRGQHRAGAVPGSGFVGV